MDKPFVERPRNGHFRKLLSGSDQVEVEGDYRDGIRNGTWRWYYPNGRLRWDIAYRGGLKNGPEKGFFESGAPRYAGQNEDDLRTGPWEFLHESGAVSEQVSYVQGKLHGDHVWDQADGRPRARGAWDRGQRTGKWTWWDEPNYEMQEREHLAGAAHGLEWARYPGGQMAFRKHYDRGRLHGTVETWGKDGKLTQRSTYAWGRLHGEHETWSGDAHTLETYWHGVPTKLLTDDKKLDALAKKVVKAKDGYKKMETLSGAVEHGARASLLVHLWREGKLDLAKQPDLWEELSNVHELLEGSEVMGLLASAKAPDYGAHLPGWPRSLDRLAMNIALRDPQPFTRGWHGLAEPLRSGLASALLRLGAIDKEELARSGAGDLGAALAARKGQIEQNILWKEDGRIVERELFRYAGDGGYEETPAFAELVALYSTPERYARALLDAALTTPYQLPIAHLARAFAVASEGELVRLLNVTSLDNFTTQQVHKALAVWRDDPPEVLARVALATEKTGLVKRTAIACAILRHEAQSLPIPDALCDAFDVDADIPTNMPLDAQIGALPEAHRHDLALIDSRVCFAGDASPQYPRLALQVKALRAMGPARAAASLRRQMKTQYHEHNVAGALHVAPGEALWREGIEAARTSQYGANRLMPLGHLPIRALPLLAEALEKETDAERRASLTHAILLCMARACDEGAVWDDRYDALVRFDCTSKDWDYPNVRPLLRKIVHRAEHAQDILLRAFEVGPVAFARAFAFVASQPTEAVLARAFDRLVELESLLRSEDIREIEAGLRALADKRDWIAWLLRAGAGSKLTPSFESVLGPDDFAKLKKEIAGAGAAVAAPKDRVEQLVDQAARIVAERRCATERIYVLRRREDAPGPESVARIGGLPLGVGAERWPLRDGEPMTHLFTLDLAQMPELARRYPGKRAFSLFMSSPDDNEAYTLGNGWTATILSTDDDVIRGELDAPEGADVRSPLAFDVVPLDVPANVWADHDGDLYKSIYRASARVLGPPIWLQGDEDEWDGGRPVMQLDEGFVDVNLGDMGILYVFDDGAFWQCH